MSLAPGAKLGSYEIVAPLGAGGMGQVYRARDPRLDREVAIKVLPADTARDPGALARFEREAMSVAKLSHPNILSIFEFARDGDTSFVVTELLDGETLRARLERGPLPARRAVAYALQIARGIGAAHARGIVHRDLKPENVMITRDDHVKILDFGLAKPFDIGDADMTRAGHTSAGTILGTLGYMAPNRCAALPVDQRADIFAFGAVLYEMLSGERAFKGDTAADSMTAILTAIRPISTRRGSPSLRPRPHRPALSGEIARHALPIGNRSGLRARIVRGTFVGVRLDGHGGAAPAGRQSTALRLIAAVGDCDPRAHRGRSDLVRQRRGTGAGAALELLHQDHGSGRRGNRARDLA